MPTIATFRDSLPGPERHDARGGRGPERLLSAGRALPGVEVRIVDPATLEDVPADEHDEIWLRTPQLMAGFLGRPEATAEVVVEALPRNPTGKIRRPYWEGRATAV